jgi:hypothetical protein
MAITYTNKNGRLYYLCSKTNEHSKRVYFLSRKPKGNLVDEMPPNYEVDENESGVVTLRKKGKRKNKFVRNQPNLKRRSGRPICPVCRAEMTQTGLKQHIKKHHPNYRPTKPVWKTINNPITQRKVHRSGQPMQGNQVYSPRKSKLDPEPFECGWCYEPIWRILQSNGYYRYYDDKSLTRKHKCTRPVHWRPDKG